ncbi:MAG: beta strand repeat-containing protein, partial [Acidiferrobacteraceae bacterium]
LTLTSSNAAIDQTGGILTAGTLTGSSAGSVTLNDANLIGTLGSFNAANFSLSNAQALAVNGPLTTTGNAGTINLTTTSGALSVNTGLTGGVIGLSSAGNLALSQSISGSTVSLDGNGGLTLNADVTATGTLTLTSSNAAIDQTGGILTAGTLTGSSAGSVTLNDANLISNLGTFTATGFSLINNQALTVGSGATVDGGTSMALTTTTGDLTINGTVKGTATTLKSAGTISEGVGGNITAGTLTGSAAGPTLLGRATAHRDNHVSVLGGFSSPAGFSFTNDQTLTLASVGGSAYTVDTGTAPLYLSVSNGNLLQIGSTPLYDGTGIFSSTGGIGSPSAPIYVVSANSQFVAMVGIPPAYFYAVNQQGVIIPVAGQLNVNVPGSALASRAQNSNSHAYGYVDASVVSANYRPYGIVPPGIRLPADQQSCSPEAYPDNCRNGTQ